VIIYTLGLSSLSLSQHHMGMLSMTAGPEIIGEDDDGVWGWRLPPDRFMSRVTFWRFGVKDPRKLNTFIYPRVNFASIFANKCYEDAEVSQMPVGLYHPHLVPCISR